MASLRDALGEAVRDSACTLLGAASTYARNFQNILEAIAPDTPFPQASPAAGMSAAYGLLCNREPPPLVNPPPFTGGQCVGTNYRVTVDYTFVSGLRPGGVRTETPQQQIFTAIGKINGVTHVTTTNNTTLVLQADSGNQTGGGGSSGFNNNIDIENERITSITVVGGGADLCGDPVPPPVVPDPDPTVDDRDVTYEDNDNVTITNNFTLRFGDVFIDTDSQINIPVNIQNNDNSDFQINANLNFNTGDINYYAGNPSYPPGSGQPGKDAYKPGNDLPPVPPTIPTTEPPPFPDTSEAEAQDIIAGAVVTVSEVPPDITVIFQSENPNIYAPNLGYIAFEIIVGGSTAWSSDIPVKNLRNVIACDWPAGAIDVKGTPRAGVNWEITPLYLTRTVTDQ